jgi:GMP synthase-like glutamine amidotransferase
MSIVLVDNREAADCELQKSTPARLKSHLHHACRKYGATLRIVRTRSDVADLLHVRVAGIVLGGSSLSLSTRLQLETIAHATAMVARFPFANVMGVCFGHQVLASLFGGAVGRLAERSQGWVPVAPNGSEARLRYCNHADHVTELPPGFRQTHTDSRDLVMGMESTVGGRLILGLQFHPEAELELPGEIDEFVRIAVSPRARL